MTPRFAAISLLLMSLLEAATFAVWLARGLSEVALVVLHIGLASGAVIVGWGIGCTELLIGAMAMLAAGPAGAAIASFVILTGSRRSAHASLDEWHAILAGDQLVSAEAEVATRLRSGQALDANRAMPKRFEDIFETGSLRDQQALLGIVAQCYHPSFRTVLQKALQSRSAPIRVQAASVFTALRTREMSRLVEAKAPFGLGKAGDADLRAVALLASSQFLDDTERSTMKTLLSTTLDSLASSLCLTDPRRAARVRILANAGLLQAAADLAHRAPAAEWQPRPDRCDVP